MSNQSGGILAFIGGLLTVIALFLSWFSRDIFLCMVTINGFGELSECGEMHFSNLQMGGTVMILGSILILVLSVLLIAGTLRSKNVKVAFTFILLCSIISLIGFIYYAWGAQDVTGYIFNNLYETFNLQLGFFLAIIGIVISLVVSFRAVS